MPRYFFSIRCDNGPLDLAVDEEGDELPDVAAARRHARTLAQDLIARHRMSLIRDWFACTVEVTDEAGERVFTLPFADTVPDSF